MEIIIYPICKDTIMECVEMEYPTMEVSVMEETKAMRVTQFHEKTKVKLVCKKCHASFEYEPENYYQFTERKNN